MGRRTSTTPVKIWSYGSKNPDRQDATTIDENLAAYHRYYNALVDVYRKQMSEHKELRNLADPEIPKMEARVAELIGQLAEVRSEVSSQNSDAQKRQKASKEQVARIKHIESELKVQSRELRSACRLANAIGMDNPDSLSPGDKAKDPKKHESAIRFYKALCEKFGDNLPHLYSEWKRIHDEFLKRQRECRAKSLLGWGTYSAVERSVKAAVAASVKAKPEAPDLRSRPPSKIGEGRVVATLQSGSDLMFSDVLSGKSKVVQISAPPGGWSNWNFKRAARVVATLRVESFDSTKVVNVKGKDKTVNVNNEVFISVPVYIHRLPPQDAKVTLAWIKVSRTGFRREYEFQMTLESDMFTPRPMGSGVVSVDLGWKVDGDRVQVAKWEDDTGASGVLYLEPGHDSGDHLPRKRFIGNQTDRGVFDHCEHLLHTSDNLFNEACDGFLKWAKSQSELPGWAVDAVPHIPKWRNHKKLHHMARLAVGQFSSPSNVEYLWNRWQFERFGSNPKQDLYASFDTVDMWLVEKGVVNPSERMALCLEWWRRKDRHLVQWSRDKSKKTRTARKTYYRKIALDFARKYRHVLLKDTDHSKSLRDIDPEDADIPVSIEKGFHRIGRIAALGEFQSALEYAFGQKYTHLHDGKPSSVAELMGKLSSPKVLSLPQSLPQPPPKSLPQALSLPQTVAIPL